MFKIFYRDKFKEITKYLNLAKPLVIFSLETTGDSISADKIVSIAYMKILLDGRIIKEEFLLNPKMEISKEAIAVHGITNKDIKGKPTFRDKAQEMWSIFNNCCYAGFNIINFDLLLLRREFIRVGMDFEYDNDDVFDSRIVFNYMEPRTLSGAYKHYCKQDYVNVHHTMADVEAEASIIEKQLEKYEEIRDWNFIKEINRARDEVLVEHERKFYWRNSEAYFNFSKYKDAPLSEVVRSDPAFLEWILKADFSEDTKNIVKRAIRGKLLGKKKKK